jgi:hypothetical protein
MSQQRNLFTGGLSLTLRSWPALVWTYVFNLGLALLFTLPLHFQINAITAHSLASQRLSGAFDLGVLAGVISSLGQGPGPATPGSHFSILVYFVLYFLLVPGALFCYQTGTSARLSSLLQSGFLHFWRFVRITLISLVVSGLILAGFMALQKLWTAHVDKHTVGLSAVLHDLAGLLIVALVAAFLRLYFDLVQVYTVQLGRQSFPQVAGSKSHPERQIRRAFKPAWKALAHNFFRTYLTFILLAALGLIAFVLSARIAIHSLAQPHIWAIFLSAQIGLFLMLLTRFWQRGAETILAMDNPLPEPAAIAPAPIVPEAPPAEPEPAADEAVIDAPE